MMNSLLSRGVSLLLMLLTYKNTGIQSADVKKLPYCPGNENDIGFILVSTLDGKISSIDSEGNLLWDIDTGPGPLLTSNIHKVELTNNGDLVRIIPSLTGSLYKFNGKTIDAIPITADSLLKSSFLYSNDLVIAGGRDVRTYGIIAKTGDMLYECTLNGCANKTEPENEFDDIIILERSTITVRAHEPRTGHERWNFSVGNYNIKIPAAECINLDAAINNLNISAVLPKGILTANKMTSQELLWQYMFPTPIVKIWKWNGRDLIPVDVFTQATPIQTSIDLSPAIYLGMHDKQLYIHESVRMMQAIQSEIYAKTEVIESTSLTRIPWKPISAIIEDEIKNDDTTALSALYSSGYIDGSGYYFYTEMDIDKKNTILCDYNTTKKFFNRYMSNEHFYWEQFFTLLITGISAVLAKYFYNIRRNRELRIAEPPETSDSNVTLETRISETKSERSISESSDMPYASRYMDEFDTVQCLGKGGYGTVFESKQKIDECVYAVKRIPLRQGKAIERVLREVKALAKLEHKNIVRYCTCWLEKPPAGWKYDCDHLTKDFSTTIETESEDERSKTSNQNKNSTVISISEDLIVFENEKSNDDSFIFFGDNSNSTQINDKTIDSNSNETLTSNVTDLSCSVETAVENDKRINFLFIQMQLCKKESLKDWLRSNPNRDKFESIDLYKEILDAVKYIHKQKLIHRDLKPSNIFFSLEGTIKVGDFGLATPMKSTESDDIVTESSMRSHTHGEGTYFYMSPEQIKGKDYNYKVDIFSLGVILFELLVPFCTEMERYKTLTKLGKNEYPDGFFQNHPNECKILREMLSENPQQRPDVADIEKKLNESYYEEPKYTSLPSHLIL